MSVNINVLKEIRRIRKKRDCFHTKDRRNMINVSMYVPKRVHMITHAPRKILLECIKE